MEEVGVQCHMTRCIHAPFFNSLLAFVFFKHARFHPLVVVQSVDFTYE